jgi:hypothetical protein
MSSDINEGYGGIWVTGKPFALNIKCVIIGIVAACIYMLPRFDTKGNLFMMAFIFAITYILISFYDYIYNCTPHMYSRGISVTGIFKPQYAGEEKPPPEGEKYDNQNKVYLRSVYWAHAAVIAPIFLYGSWSAIQQEKTGTDKKNSIYPIMFGLSSLAIFYHIFRIIFPRKSCLND